MALNVEEFRWVIPSSIKPLLLWIVIWVYFLSWIRVSPCVSKALLLFLCKNWFWWIQHLFGTTLKSQGHFAKAWKTTIYLSFLFLEYYSILNYTILKNWIFILTNMYFFLWIFDRKIILSITTITYNIHQIDHVFLATFF